MKAPSQHTIKAIRSGSHPTMGDWEAEYTITFRYTPGSPDYWNKAGGHWEQGWGPEIEYISHSPISDYPPAAENEAEWCQDWLDEHADECADIAAAMMERQP
jgi:hypothetical protein